MIFIKTLTSILLAPLIVAMNLAGYGVLKSDVIDQKIETQVESQLEETIESQNFGAFAPTGGDTYRLRNSISSSATSITLSSFKEPVSNIPYTMAYLGSEVGYGTINPGVPGRSEFISFSGITQHASGTAILTGVTRGLTRTPGGSACTASTTLAMAHPGTSTFILSDSPCLFAEYAVKRNNETITGQWTFSTFPITPSNSAASETVAGVAELATALETASSTSSGTAGRLAIPAVQATSTYNSATAALKVVVTQNDGKIDDDFISTTIAPPIGSITAYSTTTAPTGWLLADGSAVSRTTYSALYTVIGTSYGIGDGSSTFNLPNLTGRTIVMASTTQTATSTTDGTPNTRSTLGYKGGETTHTSTVNEMPAHSHGISNGSSDGANAVADTADVANINNLSTGAAGNTVPFNVLDPYIILNYIIKY